MTQASLPNVVVSLAFLEFMTPSLPELLPQLTQAGCAAVTVVPVFLGQGGHVLRDLPAMVESLQKEHAELTLRVVDAVGEDAQVLNAISQYCIAAVT